MLESVLSGFTDISLLELILIAGMALIASVVGGVAGYGTGALMPLVLVPIVGAEPVVPILSLSAPAAIPAFAATVEFWRYTDHDDFVMKPGKDFPVIRSGHKVVRTSNDIFSPVRICSHAVAFQQRLGNGGACAFPRLR